MQIENDYDKEVYNGDVGYIVDVDPEAGKLAATFDGRSVTYGFGELDTLGVKLTVAASLMAAIGDIHRFSHPGKLVSYFGLNPSVRQSGRGPAHYGRISKIGRSHARAMLVEAAWAAAKAPGPLHAFFVRIRAKRGHQIAAVAVARKVAVLCWHVLTKEQDYCGRGRRLSPTRCALCSSRRDFRRRKAISADPPTPITSRRCAARN